MEHDFNSQYADVIPKKGEEQKPCSENIERDSGGNLFFLCGICLGVFQMLNN